MHFLFLQCCNSDQRWQCVIRWMTAKATNPQVIILLQTYTYNINTRTIMKSFFNMLLGLRCENTVGLLEFDQTLFEQTIVILR